MSACPDRQGHSNLRRTSLTGMEREFTNAPSLTNWSILRVRKPLGSLTDSALLPSNLSPASPVLQAVLCLTYLLQKCIQRNWFLAFLLPQDRLLFRHWPPGGAAGPCACPGCSGLSCCQSPSSPGREIVFVRATVSAFNQRQRPRFSLLVPKDNLFIRMRYKHRAPEGWPGCFPSWWFRKEQAIISVQTCES